MQTVPFKEEFDKYVILIHLLRTYGVYSVDEKIRDGVLILEIQSTEYEVRRTISKSRYAVPYAGQMQ